MKDLDQTDYFDNSSYYKQRSTIYLVKKCNEFKYYFKKKLVNGIMELQDTELQL